MAVWKVFLAIVLNVCLFVGTPLLFAHWHLISDLKQHAAWILGATALALLLKIVLGDIISGDFMYYKHGYDLCIMTMSASLSSLAIQVTSSEPYLRDLPTTGPFLRSAFELAGKDLGRYSLIVLATIFGLSCLFTVLTAWISKALKSASVKILPQALSLFNFLCGAGLLGCYMLMLIGKG